MQPTTIALIRGKTEGILHEKHRIVHNPDGCDAPLLASETLTDTSTDRKRTYERKVERKRNLAKNGRWKVCV